MPRVHLIDLVKRLAFLVAPPGQPFRLKSGRESDYYLDCRKLTLDGDGLREVVREMGLVIPKLLSPLVVGGPSVGADPIVGGLLTWGVAAKGFLVRPEAKGHGTGGRIVGNLEPGDRVALVEDVATTGGSLLDAVRVVREAGAEVVLAVAVVDRLEGASALLEADGVPFRPLLTVEDLREG